MRIRVIDAFTDRPFAGNPAAVCLLEGDSWPEEAWMQAVASELALSETAFAHPLTGTAGADWALRWFTPALEVDLCGHATLATAYALHLDRGGPGTVRFTSRGGVLVTHTRSDATVVLDFPAAATEPVSAPAGLAEALGVSPQASYATGTLGDLLVLLPDERAVRAATPDQSALAALLRRERLRGLILTAAAEAGAGHDFVSRFFAPTAGIPEDPVTGSAHTALAPFWSARLGRSRLSGWQASRRGGRVITELAGDRVHLTGNAVVMLEATLRHPPPGA